MIQVIRRLTRHAAIRLDSSYLEWRGRNALGRSDNNPNDESITFVYGLIRIRLAKVPHYYGIGIQSVMRGRTIPGLLAVPFAMTVVWILGLHCFSVGSLARVNFPNNMRDLIFGLEYAYSSRSPKQVLFRRRLSP